MLGNCVYCGAALHPRNRTDDHVISRRFFPKSALELPKWKVPSCNDCNHSFSRDEGILLQRLGMCLDPNDPDFGEIAQAARRSIDPRAGKSLEDSVRRLNAKLKIRSEVKPIASANAVGVLPSFRENFEKGSRTGVLIPKAALESVVAKWARGLFFAIHQRALPVDVKVDAFFVDDKTAAEAFKEISDSGRFIHRGNGVQIVEFLAEEEGRMVALYAFNLWQSFRAYASLDYVIISETDQHRQSRAVAMSAQEREDQAFVDAVSDYGSE